MQQKILIIKLGALGDFIYALGPMAAIRGHHPDAHITLLTTQPYASMGWECGYFDDVMVDKRPRAMNVLGWLKLRNTLNKERYARVYDLQNNDRTTAYFKLFNPKPEWVGAVKGASHCNASPERSNMHAYLGHCQTLAVAGIDDVTFDNLQWMKGDVSALNLAKKYILIVPGCSPAHPEKRWPVAHYRALVSKILLHGVQPVILGTRDDIAATEAITRGFGGILDLTGKTALSDIPALARGALCAVGNDTGPMHMAALSGCPVIMLFCNQTSSIRMHAPPKAEGVYAFEDMDLQNIAPSVVWEKVQKFF